MVTGGQTDRQTTLSCQYPIILRAVYDLLTTELFDIVTVKVNSRSSQVSATICLLFARDYCALCFDWNVSYIKRWVSFLIKHVVVYMLVGRSFTACGNKIKTWMTQVNGFRRSAAWYCRLPVCPSIRPSVCDAVYCG